MSPQCLNTQSGHFLVRILTGETTIISVPQQHALIHLTLTDPFSLHCMCLLYEYMRVVYPHQHAYPNTHYTLLGPFILFTITFRVQLLVTGDNLINFKLAGNNKQTVRLEVSAWDELI